MVSVVNYTLKSKTLIKHVIQFTEDLFVLKWIIYHNIIYYLLTLTNAILLTNQKFQKYPAHPNRGAYLG